MKGNKSAGQKNNRKKIICAAQHPTEKDWVCSLAAGHNGEEHKAYWGHDVTMRTRFYADWYTWQGTPGRSKDEVADDDDVAAALASIQATMSSRLPPATVAARIAETNTALAEKFDGSGVSVQIHVQTPLRVELDEIIDRLVLLRDSLP